LWSSLLEAVRRRRSSPEARLAEIGLSKGMKVADIGAGYGYYAFPAAEIVGKDGMVYAVEPDPKRAEEISRRVLERGVRNVKVVQASAEEIAGISSGEVHVAISISSFHHFADVQRGLLELRRIVKPGGLVYIRDIKAGRIFKHGSSKEGFRTAVTQYFPGAEFQEGSGYLVAKALV